jgi:hypothetical protein
MKVGANASAGRMCIVARGSIGWTSASQRVFVLGFVAGFFLGDHTLGHELL